MNDLTSDQTLRALERTTPLSTHSLANSTDRFMTEKRFACGYRPIHVLSVRVIVYAFTENETHPRGYHLGTADDIRSNRGDKDRSK